MTNQEIRDYSLKISQSSRTGLIVIMYEMAVKYIDDGVLALKSDNVSEYRTNLKRAKSVINELVSILDMKYEISYQLRNIYVFMIKALVRADIRKEMDELVRIREMLLELRKAFIEAGKNDNSGAVMQNTQQVYAGLTYSRTSLNENMYSDVNRGYKV